MLYFQKGVTTHTGPLFPTTGGTNPFDGIDAGVNTIPCFADIDGDGDLDLFVGSRSGTVYYFENIGTPTEAAFAPMVSNPFGLPRVNRDSAPALADIDSDGDLDAFVGGGGELIWGTVSYFENTGTPTSPAFTERTGAANPLDAVRNDCVWDSYAYPAFVDIDGDGDLDAYVGGDLTNEISLWENTGTATNPIFVEVTGAANPLDGFRAGESKPSFSDIDSDGDMDALLGGMWGLPLYLINVGSKTAPDFVACFGSANPLTDRAAHEAPAFADLDGDGDEDLYMAHRDGTIRLWRNGPSSVQGTAATPPASDSDVTPALLDLLQSGSRFTIFDTEAWAANVSNDAYAGFWGSTDGWLDHMPEWLFDTLTNYLWKKRRFTWLIDS